MVNPNTLPARALLDHRIDLKTGLNTWHESARVKTPVLRTQRLQATLACHGRVLLPIVLWCRGTGLLLQSASLSERPNSVLTSILRPMREGGLRSRAQFMILASRFRVKAAAAENPTRGYCLSSSWAKGCNYNPDLLSDLD